MGGGSNRPVVTPSEVHRYVYCPRQFFFEVHVGRERGLRERARLLLGRLFHALLGLRDRLRGLRVEEGFHVDLGGVRLVGRPDAYFVDGDSITVVERKSGRAPRRGAWESDVYQATAYAVALRLLLGASGAKAVIEYRDAKRPFSIDDELVASLIRVVDELVLVKYYGVVPAARRSQGRCSRCPFRDLCQELDEHLPLPEPAEEPGAWLAGFRLNLRTWT